MILRGLWVAGTFMSWGGGVNLFMSWGGGWGSLEAARGDDEFYMSILLSGVSVCHEGGRLFITQH